MSVEVTKKFGIAYYLSIIMAYLIVGLIILDYLTIMNVFLGFLLVAALGISLSTHLVLSEKAQRMYANQIQTGRGIAC